MALEHLRNEVDILLTLGPHPCVVEVFEVYEEAFFIYIAFEFVEFGDLFDLGSTETPSEAETRFIHKQLLEATKFMHGEGVVHRDFKPENVLVADKAKFHMKLTDFGLAKVQQADELLTTRCGTLAYAAPEVLGTSEQKQYDKGCDLWSLGAVLYVCLCGAAPFDDAMTSESMAKSQEDVLKGLSRVNTWKTISDEAKELVERHLTVIPSNRATVEEALAHSWMQLEPSKLEAMLNAVPLKF